MKQPAPFHPICSADYLPREKRAELQLARLRKIVAHEYAHVPLYRDRMDAQGVKPEDIRTLADIAKLPFMMKTDLRDTYPFGLFASPMEDIVRIHASSGTTGKRIILGYTQGDIDIWSECVARGLANAGVTTGDKIHIAYGYGLFTGGLGLHDGAQRLGATVIPASGGNTEQQINLLRDLGANIIACTPSYFVHLIDKAEKMGVDLRELPLRAGFFGAEPWTEEMRAYIEEHAGIEAFDIYGLTEISGPGVGLDCAAHHGIHIFEEYFYPEIIDPDTLQPVPDGVEGELVFTTLCKFGAPMIRYRTRDISRIIPEICPCGRTLRRIDRIRRRSDDMIIFHGVNIFPSQVEAALLQVDASLPHYRIQLDSGASGLDIMTIEIEIRPEMVSDRVEDMEALRRKFAAALDTILNIHAVVKLMPPNALPRSEGKAKRVFDNRKPQLPQ